MVTRGSGHVVNTSSMNGLTPFGSFAAYSASKFAVLGLSDALRDELAPARVRASTLFPGFTRSRMAETDAVVATATDPVWLGRAVVHESRTTSPTSPHIRSTGRALLPATSGFSPPLAILHNRDTEPVRRQLSGRRQGTNG